VGRWEGGIAKSLYCPLGMVESRRRAKDWARSQQQSKSWSLTVRGAVSRRNAVHKKEGVTQNGLKALPHLPHPPHAHCGLPK